MEQPRGPAGDALRLHGYEIATVRAALNMPRVIDGDHVTLAPDAEVAQPLYARYWLHNRGPAPLGGLPVVAHLHPHVVAAEPGTPVQVRLTAASDCSDAVLHGSVRLVVPPQWAAQPDELPFMLPPGEHLETTVDADDARERGARSVSRSAPNSRSPATGRSPPRGARWSRTSAWSRSGRPTDHVLRLLAEPHAVDVAAGEVATLSVTVGTDAYADLAAEAHLISPWGTWEWLGPSVISAAVPARGSVALDFDVAPPAWVEPGEWWALIRIACAGHLIYTPAVQVTVR